MPHDGLPRVEARGGAAMTAELSTVQQAWAAVMTDVRALGKDQRTDSGTRFNFRGVDDVMNLVGPVLRQHGVSVVPTSVTHHPENYSTKTGTAMRNVTVLVTYAIHGPAGDTMPGAAAGEASDAGDKATPKAMSVAFRTFLLQSLCLPTEDRDPDMDQYERSAEPVGPSPMEAKAQEVADRLGLESDLEKAQSVQAWVFSNEMQDILVLDSAGDRLPLGSLCARIVTKLEADGQRPAA